MADEVFEWIDVDSGATTLAVAEIDGRYMPPIRRVEEIVPLQAGGRLRSTRHGIRDVRLLLRVDAASTTALRTELRALLLALDPTRGDGRLRVTAPGGDQRELYCRYVGGLEFPEDPTILLAHTTAPAVFRAVDPYWYDTTTSGTTFTTGTPASFFPIFPLRLAASEVFADGSINNTGDVESWPTWTIAGPGSSIVLRNLTTGKALTLSETIAAGEVVTIDTRPGVKTVLRQDGVSLFSSLSATSSLWPLARGTNAIRVEMSGATADSEVTISYRRRYLPT